MKIASYIGKQFCNSLVGIAGTRGRTFRLASGSCRFRNEAQYSGSPRALRHFLKMHEIPHNSNTSIIKGGVWCEANQWCRRTPACDRVAVRVEKLRRCIETWRETGWPNWSRWASGRICKKGSIVFYCTLWFSYDRCAYLATILAPSVDRVSRTIRTASSGFCRWSRLILQ